MGSASRSPMAAAQDGEEMPKKSTISNTLGITCPWAFDQTMAFVCFLVAASGFYGVIVPALAAHSIGWAVVAMLHVMAFAVVALCWFLLVCANPGAEPSLVPLPASKAIL